MDIRMQELLDILVISLCIALFIASIFIKKYRIFDYRKDSEESFSRKLAKVTMIVTGILGFTGIIALIISVIQN